MGEKAHKSRNFSEGPSGAALEFQVAESPIPEVSTSFQAPASRGVSGKAGSLRCPGLLLFPLRRGWSSQAGIGNDLPGNEGWDEREQRPAVHGGI